MARYKAVGIDTYIKTLSKLDEHTEEAIGTALYEGAGVIADAVRSSINSIPTDDSWGTEEHPATGLHPKQKAGLQEGFGISSMQQKGEAIDVRIGFDGHNAFTTQKFPGGQPNALIARALESGTSFRSKNPFFSRALSSSSAAAKETAKEALERVLNQYNN